MSATELVPEPTAYSDIAAIHGRRSLLYVMSGDYQGEWLMFALDGKSGEYAIYRDWYGSCSGCDDLQATFGYSGETARATVEEWAAKYPPFALVPQETMKNLVSADSLLTIFPANVRDASIDMEGFVRECGLLVRLEEELELTPEMALSSNNQETRRRIMERLGIDQFVVEAIADDGADRLVRCTDEGVYLWLQDASTERQYLLRVPPETRTVKAGKAWSFGLKEEEYAPLIET